MQAVATSRSLRAVLEQALDYAGLFPPAALDLRSSARLYAKFRSEPESWMLGRFVVPVYRYEELRRLVESMPDSEPWPLSVLGSSVSETTECLTALRHDLHTISTLERQSRTLHTRSMEVRWPADAFTSGPGHTLALLRDLPQAFAEASTSMDTFFLEIPAHVCEGGSCDIVAAIAACNEQNHIPGTPVLGAKLRCGGTTADAFPSVRQVAGFLQACTRAPVPFKLTAGLHHPLYQFDAPFGVYTHGFLNVFTASVLLSEHAMDVREIGEMLQDGDIANFYFSDDELGWQGRRVKLPAIREARQGALQSFGSCSFDEPRNDLRQLGLL